MNGKHKITVSLIIAALLCGSAPFGTLAAAEPAAHATSITIPAGELKEALKVLVRQTGVQLLYDQNAVKGVHTRGAKAANTPQEAIAELLRGTALVTTTDSSGAILILTPESAALSSGARNSDPRTPGGNRHLLQLTAVAAGPEAAAAQGDAATTQPAARQSSTKEQDDSADSQGIPEMLVKGARSLNTDIRRTENDVQPYMVFDAKQIDRSMAGTLDEFLRMNLPMNTTVGSSVQNPTNPFGDRSSINLRGLGDDETLVLVNGRRMPGFSYGSSAPGQADLNGIPMSSVKRIEVLPSTAGGIYGGGATGGVVNIILKDDYSGLQANYRYQNAFDTDASVQQYGLNGGYAFENGKTRLTFSLNRTEQNAMLVRDRDFLQRATDMVVQNNPAVIYDTNTPPTGATSNIHSVNGQPLVLKNGNRSLGYAYASVPVGYAGPESDNGAAFLTTAGEYNLQVPEGLGGLDRSLQGTPTKEAMSLSLRRAFGEHLDVYVDGLYNKTTSRSETNGFPTSVITLQQDAPNNPFTEAVNVRFPASDFDHASRQEYKNTQFSASAGAIARLPHRWSAQAEYTFGRSTRPNRGTRATIQEISTALAEGTLDIMRDVNAYPLDYADYYFTPSLYSFQVRPYATQTDNYSLRAAGPVLDLRGGPLAVSGLVERREMQMLGAMTATYSVPNVVHYNFSPQRKQVTDSYYVEITTPLFSRKNGFAGMRGLDLQASYRYDKTATTTLDDYLGQVIRLDTLDTPLPDIGYQTTSVTANQYTLGLRYRPVDSIALRVSYGSGVLPPSLTQLIPLYLYDYRPFGARDPKRKNDPVDPVDIYSTFGFPGLQPEESSSWSAGLIFTPAGLPGFRASVDYTQIDKTNELTSLFLPQQMIDLEDYFPGRIVRNPLTAEDQLNGYTIGTIKELYSGYINFAKTKVESYDFRFDYDWSTAYGEFHANVSPTYQPHLIQQAQATTLPIENVGYSGGPQKWRANAGLSWERNSWTAGWSMQYYDKYFIYSASASESLRASSVANQGSDTVPSQIYHDVFVKYRFDNDVPYAHGIFSNSELLFGISNVLNTSPPIIADTTTTGIGYSTAGNPLLRRYSISLRKGFGGN